MRLFLENYAEWRGVHADASIAKLVRWNRLPGGPATDGQEDERHGAGGGRRENGREGKDGVFGPELRGQVLG